MRPCKAAQFVVDHRDELVERRRVACAPPKKKRGHRLTRLFGHRWRLVSYGKLVLVVMPAADDAELRMSSAFRASGQALIEQDAHG